MIFSYINLTIDSTVTHQKCRCGKGLESAEHSFLHCQFYADQMRVLTDSVSEVIGNEVQVYPEQHLPYVFFYGSKSYF